MSLFNSGVVKHPSTKPNRPVALTSDAALSKPVMAARCSEVATLTRSTPAATRSSKDNDFPFVPAMKLAGFDTAQQTARTTAQGVARKWPLITDKIESIELEGRPLPWRLSLGGAFEDFVEAFAYKAVFVFFEHPDADDKGFSVGGQASRRMGGARRGI
jgi:hypothetical protein